jgi:phosphomannomutase
MATDSAPQIMNSIGTDTISINAQKDRNFLSNSLSIKETDIRHMKALVEANAGSIGISLNRIGTLLRVFDESGDPLTDEQVLAVLMLYLKPKRIVVPMDMTGFIADLFNGKVKVKVSTPHPDPDPGEMEFVMVHPDVGSLHKAIKEHDADLGYYAGGFVFNSISLSSDAILASVILSQFAGNNSLKSVVASFPEYYSERKSYKFSCTQEEFKRMIDEYLPDINPTKIIADGAWRAEMDGGNFYIAFNKDSDDTVDVIAESNDKLYLISLIEVIDGLIERCEPGQ